MHKASPTTIRGVRGLVDPTAFELT